jgi:hypothetical protein
MLASAISYPENQALVAFVDAAAGEIIKKGEAVFPEFRQKNGRWFRGERYVFVMDLEGNRYVYPPDPANERVNLLADRDLGGKPIGKLLVDRARQGDGRGWVHYQWNRPQPEHRRPVWKSTYVVRVQAPSGKTYLVGSGIYEGPMEKSFVVDEVNAAVRLLQVQGRAGFDQLRDPASRFVFRDTYVFVNSPDGVELVNAGFPELEGRNLMGLEDAEGTTDGAQLHPAGAGAGFRMDQLPLAPAGPLPPAHPQVHLREKGGASRRRDPGRGSRPLHTLNVWIHPHAPVPAPRT